MAGTRRARVPLSRDRIRREPEIVDGPSSTISLVIKAVLGLLSKAERMASTR